MEEQHLTQQSFASLIGISPAALSSIFNDRTKPTLAIVDAIKKTFPDISLDWLLYGVEPMHVRQDAAGKARMENGEEAQAASPVPTEATINFADGAPGSLRDAAAMSSSSFEQGKMQGVNRTLKNIAQTEVKYIDKPQRKITEIRIFYDDQTWETFVPKK